MQSLIDQTSVPGKAQTLCPSCKRYAATENRLSATEPSSQTHSRTALRYQLRLHTIFQNPVLLSSFLRNFERKDYAHLAQIAASIPDIQPWPAWDPLTEPWPRGKLPFDIQDLRVACGNQRVPLRHLVDRGEGDHSEDSR